jgi:hypothetical protein
MYRRLGLVGGQSIMLYSEDGATWFMKPVDAMNHQRKVAAQLEENRQRYLRSYSDLEDIGPILAAETVGIPNLRMLRERGWR